MIVRWGGWLSEGGGDDLSRSPGARYMAYLPLRVLLCDTLCDEYKNRVVAIA